VTEVETNGHERREDAPRCVKCGKAWPCEGWLLEPPRLQPAPIPASPARDARIDAYRDRQRRRAARALDRYFETLLGDTVGMGPAVSVAGERFVEDMADYVAARLSGMLPDGMSVTYDRSPLQQKSHYGVEPDRIDECLRCGGPLASDRVCADDNCGADDEPHNADVGPEVITTTDRDHALHVQNRDPVSWCRQCVGPFFDV
jgi:hypothetical protein